MNNTLAFFSPTFTEIFFLAPLSWLMLLIVHFIYSASFFFSTLICSICLDLYCFPNLLPIFSGLMLHYSLLLMSFSVTFFFAYTYIDKESLSNIKKILKILLHFILLCVEVWWQVSGVTPPTMWILGMNSRHLYQLSHLVWP